MTALTKCRANDPAICNDPNCPEKRAAMAGFFGGFTLAALKERSASRAREKEAAATRTLLSENRSAGLLAISNLSTETKLILLKSLASGFGITRDVEEASLRNVTDEDRALILAEHAAYFKAL